MVEISSLMPVNDIDGKEIQSQAPYVVKFGEKWYMYGVDMSTYVFPSDPASAVFPVTCYSSPDLSSLSWKFEDTVLTVPYFKSLNPETGAWPPRVLFNAKNNQYVLIARPSNGYGGVVNVFTSSTPTGRFVFHNTMQNISSIGDFNVFVDTDGKGYLVGDYMPGRYTVVYQLNADYYGVNTPWLANTGVAIEGLGMVKHGGTYFIFGSGLTWWDPNDNFYLTAPSPAGPWTNRGLFVPQGSRTYDSQTWHVLSVSGSAGTTCVFIGQRWLNFHDGRQIWLPLVFNSNTTVATMQWYDKWYLDAQTGAWSGTTVVNGRTPALNAGGSSPRLLSHSLIAVPAGRFSLRVVNAAGVTVLRESGIGPTTRDLSSAGPGIHVVTVTRGVGTVSKTFVNVK